MWIIGRAAYIGKLRYSGYSRECPYRRLDATAESFCTSHATNAFADDIQSAMLVGVGFPTLGCWEITGQYAGTQLSFVVWVAP